MNKLIQNVKSFTPHLNTHYRIGMRVIKTAAAVTICLLIALLSGNRGAISITAVSALVTLRPTHNDTVRSGVFRLIGTMIGGMFGLLIAIIEMFLPYYSDGLFVIVIPAILLLNLYICNVLKMQDSCTISCVVTLIVAARITPDATFGEALVFTLIRLMDTLIGVVVGTVVNITPHTVSELMKKRDSG